MRAPVRSTSKAPSEDALGKHLRATGDKIEQIQSIWLRTLGLCTDLRPSCLLLAMDAWPPGMHASASVPLKKGEE